MPRKSLSFLPTTFVVGLAISLSATLPSMAEAAGPCAGNLMVSGPSANVTSPTLLTTSMACTIMAKTMISGNLIACRIYPATSRFQAVWSNTAARETSGSSGCTFTCPGGSCFLGADGLPVELLQFGVE